MKSLNIFFALSIFIFMLFFPDCTKAQQKLISVAKINTINLIKSDGKSGYINLAKPIVLIFLSPECPLCQNYLPGLVKLQNQNKQFTFYGIIPGKSYSLKEINSFKTEYAINFQLLNDPKNQLSKYLKATTTPQVFLINKLGFITYQGLIDNWPSSLGKKRLIITEKYLQDAISDLSSGKLTYKETTPVGCLINDI